MRLTTTNKEVTFAKNIIQQFRDENPVFAFDDKYYAFFV